MSDRITQRLLRHDQREPHRTFILEIAPPSKIVPDAFFSVVVPTYRQAQEAAT